MISFHFNIAPHCSVTSANHKCSNIIVPLTRPLFIVDEVYCAFNMLAILPFLIAFCVLASHQINSFQVH